MALRTTTLAAFIAFAALPAVAAPPEDWPPSVEAFCEINWADQEATTQADAEMCARYWLKRYVYGNERPESLGFSTNLPEYWLESDHYNGLDVETRVSVDKFRNMIRHVDAATPDEPLAQRIAQRARDYFEGAADARLSLRGLSSMPVSNIIPQLGKVLSGKRLSPGDLSCVTPVTLWKLQNAVFARHGAPMHDPDLETFFYGRRTSEVKRPVYTSLLPRRQNPNFSSDALSAIDKYNIDLIEQVKELDTQTRCSDSKTWGIAALY